MRVKLHRNIRYAEIDSNFQWRPGFLFRSLLEAAVKHSEEVGLGSRFMVGNGFVWILHKIALEVDRYPEYQEEIEVVTWSRGYKGFKAFRDFEIYAGSRRIAAATSIWLYLDLARKRLNRVPPDVHQAYTNEAEKAIGMDLDAWKPNACLPPQFEIPISTRNADYDPLGHVNSAVYFDYLDTLAARFSHGTRRITGLQLQYTKEIDRSVESIDAGVCEPGRDRQLPFRIRSTGTDHAAGNMVLQNFP